MAYPDKPPVIFAQHKGSPPHWLYYCEPKRGCGYFFHMDNCISYAYKPASLKIIDHPQNDKEAIEIIEGEKRNGRHAPLEQRQTTEAQ